MAWLTKSRFLAGEQCPKRLWLEVHEPLPAADEPNMPLLQGRRFDEFVQRHWPGPVVSREEGLESAIEETRDLLNRKLPPTLIHQPAFRAADQVVVADVLRCRNDGFELVEVKATTSVKDTHISDLAFQTMVIQNAGWSVTRSRLAYVNNAFVLKRPQNYADLVAEEDLTATIAMTLSQVASRAAAYTDAMNAPKAPSIAMGPQCEYPYECPYKSRCEAPSGPVIKYPIALLPRAGKVVAALAADGYQDLREVPSERLTNEVHRRVHRATVEGRSIFEVAATATLRGLGYPRAYLDFETIATPVPEFVGTRPYEQLPFQWSVHVERSKDLVDHYECLQVDAFGDFAAQVDALIRAIPAEGPVIAYNASFEATALKCLGRLVPTRRSALDSITARLLDLLPITRNAYYHPDMRGSWSIKAVIPTICGSLAYDTLDEVAEGESAQRAFLALRSPGIDPERAAKLREALLRYCRRDTWVMVVLLRFLCGAEIDGENCLESFVH